MHIRELKGLPGLFVTSETQVSWEGEWGCEESGTVSGRSTQKMHVNLRKLARAGSEVTVCL